MKEVGSAISRKAACARRLPAAARASSRVLRTETSANSEPTKNAFATTKNSTAKSFKATLIRRVDGWVSPASRARKLLAGSSIACSKAKREKRSGYHSMAARGQELCPGRGGHASALGFIKNVDSAQNSVGAGGGRARFAERPAVVPG